MDLSRRATLAERMDDDDLDLDVYRRCLADLAKVNRATFTHRPTLRWLDAALARMPPDQAVRIMDVAYGQGDLLRAIHRRCTRRGRAVRLQGIDLNPRSAAAARAATPDNMDIDYRIGDVFADAPEPKPDLIVSSQFTHHLDDAAVLAFIRWMETHAAQGWFVADLHRHAFSYHGFPLLARLAGWHRIVREDGALSIARAFRPGEWQASLAQCGLRAEVRRHFPFRLCVSRWK